MYEYDFLKTVQEQIKIYKDFPLPVVICGKDWRVYWSNDLARQFYTPLTETEGLARALAEFDSDDLLREAAENGNCTIREIFPFDSVNMSVTPLFSGENLVGAVLIFVRMDNLIDAKSFYQGTRMTGALSDSIRDVVSEIFSILDTAALKSDLMNASWIKSGFNAIAYNNYRILRIASNISEYAKHQSGILDLRLETVNLSVLLRDMCDAVEALTADMGTAVRVSVPLKDVYVNLDCGKFETAFYNVLHNALYYSRKGNEIDVTLKQNKKGDSAAIIIADKGLGIPAQALKDVTRPYFTYARSGVSKGIGLGLALAKLILDAHGGALEIRSKEGEGTTVKMVFPADTVPQGISLAQDADSHRLRDRFSQTYIGLADIFISPYK